MTARCSCDRAGLPAGARQCFLCDLDDANDVPRVRLAPTVRPPATLDAPVELTAATVPAAPPCQVTAATNLLDRIARDRRTFAGMPHAVQAAAYGLAEVATDADLVARGVALAAAIRSLPVTRRVAVWRGINAAFVVETEQRLATGPGSAS
ncbi:MAG: hypothetical protein ACEQSX_10715 [Baekduiaceae bacterium]